MVSVTENMTDGRFSDMFRRKAAMCIAMGTYMFGCLIAGFSKSIVSLIIFRGIAGAGGGGIVSVMQIVISDVVSLRDRCVLRTTSLICLEFTKCCLQREVPRYYRWRHKLRICLGVLNWRNSVAEGVVACEQR